MGRYAEAYESWKSDPLGFWAEAARDIDWISAPQQVHGPEGWFPDAICNTCWNALDRHVIEGNGDRQALISAAFSVTRSMPVCHSFALELTCSR